MGATDPARELNITVPSVRRRVNGKWLAFLLPEGTAREGAGESRAHTQPHSSTDEEEEAASRRQSTARSSAGSMTALGMATWALYLQLLSCWAFSHSPYADNAFSLWAGKSLLRLVALPPSDLHAAASCATQSIGVTTCLADLGRVSCLVAFALLFLVLCPSR